jgi:hypothetical protein
MQNRYGRPVMASFEFLDLPAFWGNLVKPIARQTWQKQVYIHPFLPAGMLASRTARRRSTSSLAIAQI